MENPNLYNGIDQLTLNKAAAKGVSLHQEIEHYELHGVIGYTTEFHNYLKVKKHYGFQKELTERMVIIEIGKEVVCAGRFDLLATINGKNLLIDFKRTSQIHQKYVMLQLNLYRLGLMQSYDINIDKLMLIRLRYDAIDVMDLPVMEQDTIDILKKYLKKPFK